MAVVPVILFHAGFAGFGGGFVGVDVFFVISGYLITTIIVTELARGRFSLIDFYERRARRILPALTIVVLATIPFAWAMMMPRDMKDFAQSLMATATFSSNILFWIEADYFDRSAELKPLLHTWSLAVEEQFYIFFPPFLMLTWRLGRRMVMPMLAVLLLASLALAQWASHAYPVAAFYLLPTRGWELLIGALAALYLTRREVTLPLAVQSVLGLSGLVMICASVVLYHEAIPFPSVYALLPTLGTVFIILFAAPGTLANRVLSLRPLVGIGLISYSAYLWHQPLLVFSRYVFYELTIWYLCLVVLATFALAYLTWRLVEQPFRNRQAIGRRQIFGGAIAASALIIGLGAHGHIRDGYDNKPDIAMLDYEYDNRKLQSASWSLLRDRANSGSYAVQNNRFDTKPWFDANDSRRKLLLVGNSHSKDLFNILTFSELAAQTFQVARYGVQIEDILGDETFLNAPNLIDSDIVMLVTRYDHQNHDSAALPGVVDALLACGKTVVLVRNIRDFPLYRSGITTLSDKVIEEAVHAGATAADAQSIAAEANRQHYQQYLARPPEYQVALSDRVIDQIAAAHPEVIVLDRMDYICDAEEQACFALDATLNKYFYDQAHHTLAGAKFFGKRIDSIGWLDALIAR